MGHTLLNDWLGDLGGVRLGLGCGFGLFVGVVNNHGAPGTKSGLANVRRSSGSDSDRCGSFGGREQWLRIRFRFRHGLTVSDVRAP